MNNIDDSSQTCKEMEKQNFQEKLFHEGVKLYQKQKEFERQKRIKEQKEMRDMLERYWPWGRVEDVKPRGLKNLRLEELFPNKDYINAQRFVGTVDFGRGGGGEPIFNRGKKMTKTKEDPLLRFQFGSKDLRRCVDNTLRYKTDKKEQEEYKKELDKLVEEKKRKEKHEKAETKQFYQQQGWSNEETLKRLETDSIKSKRSDERRYSNFKRMNTIPPNKVVRLDPIIHPKTFLPVGSTRKLSSLSGNKDDGVDLVTILAKDRKYPHRIPLCSSDVTSEKKMGKTTIWNRQGSSYLKELAQQMIYRQQQIRLMREKENIAAQEHFTAWDGFWGRPGNGAPLPEVKKRSLDRLLYPTMPPIGVH